MLCEIPSLGRCCFCLPLRKGVLIFGYLNILFSVFMIGLFSSFIQNSRHNGQGETKTLFHGSTTLVPTEFTITIYCVEIIFNCILLFGAHRAIVLYLKLYLYFVITTIVAAVLIQIVDVSRYPNIFRMIEMSILFFAGIFLQIYLAILVSSLIKKLDVGDSNTFDNQLHQVVTGERKMDNGVYDNTTVVSN